jgi:hypothetical protein
VQDIEPIKPIPIRERIKDLNTKAYYLLVALSFIYGRNFRAFSLKLAFTLTAFAAVFPIQDYVNSRRGLEIVRFFKVFFLGVALLSALWWIWTATALVPVN